MKCVEVILFSQTTKIAILLATCLSIGFIAPAIINIFLEFAPPSPYVAGTCHIKVGMRTNCFPDVDAKNQVENYLCCNYFRSVCKENYYDIRKPPVYFDHKRRDREEADCFQEIQSGCP